MWRSLHFIVAGLAIFGCISTSNCVFENEIKELLEEIRVRMCYPLFGLPALDPFHINHLQIEMDNKYFQEFSASVTNLNLTGASDFVVNDLLLNLNPLANSRINITLPLMELRTLYKAQGWVVRLLHLIGDDLAMADVESITVKLTFKLRAALNLSIRNLKIEIAIDDLHVDLGTLLEEERINDFITALINELGLELAGDLWATKKNWVQIKLENIINGLLQNVSLRPPGEEPIFGDIPGDCKDKLQLR